MNREFDGCAEFAKYFIYVVVCVCVLSVLFCCFVVVCRLFGHEFARGDSLLFICSDDTVSTPSWTLGQGTKCLRQITEDRTPESRSLYFGGLLCLETDRLKLAAMFAKLVFSCSRALQMKLSI